MPTTAAGRASVCSRNASAISRSAFRCRSAACQSVLRSSSRSSLFIVHNKERMAFSRSSETNAWAMRSRMAAEWGVTSRSCSF